MTAAAHRLPRLRQGLSRLLRHSFSRLLRRRGRSRHFLRHPLQDRYAHVGRAEPPSPESAGALLAIAGDAPAGALARLHSHPDGLTKREAAARLARPGPNALPEETTRPWWRVLADQLRDVMVVVLAAAAVVAAVAGDPQDAAVIAAILVLNTVLGWCRSCAPSAPWRRCAPSRRPPPPCGATGSGSASPPRSWCPGTWCRWRPGGRPRRPPAAGRASAARGRGHAHGGVAGGGEARRRGGGEVAPPSGGWRWLSRGRC